MQGKILNLNTCIKKYEISTVDLGKFFIKHPKLIGAYKTEFFSDGRLVGKPLRYKTEEEARKGHQMIVEHYKGKIHRSDSKSS